MLKNIGREAADIVKQSLFIILQVLKADKPKKGEHSGTDEEIVLF